MKYIYLHIDKNNTPFYVGKGNKYRTYDKHNRNLEWNRIASNGFDIIILDEVSNEVANKMESYWIDRIGRIDDGGTLVNKTKGGSGKLGCYSKNEYKIHYHKRNKKWVVRFSNNGIREWIGTFNTEAEAINKIKERR